MHKPLRNNFNDKFIADSNLSTFVKMLRCLTILLNIMSFVLILSDLFLRTALLTTSTKIIFYPLLILAIFNALFLIRMKIRPIPFILLLVANGMFSIFVLWSAGPVSIITKLFPFFSMIALLSLFRNCLDKTSDFSTTFKVEGETGILPITEISGKQVQPWVAFTMASPMLALTVLSLSSKNPGVGFIFVLMASVALISGVLLWLTSPVRGWLQIHRDNGMILFTNRKGIVSSRQLGKCISINIELFFRFRGGKSWRAILCATNGCVFLCYGRRGRKFIRAWLQPVAEWLNITIQESDRDDIPLMQPNFPFDPYENN